MISKTTNHNIFTKFNCNTLVIIIAFFFISQISLFGARIKDIAILDGSGGVQVIGYGLVTGLKNTGDNQMSTFTVQSVSNMLKRFGITIPQSNPRIRNVAAVMISATIPAYLRKGNKVDVTVSSIGDASSLQGGVLLMAPLTTVDGEIIGMAQGSVTVGGYDMSAFGSGVSKNFVTSGRVANGLILDRDIQGHVHQNNLIRIILKDPDFTTASRVASVINGLSGLNNSATPLDAGTIAVQIPAGQNQTQLIETIAQIETQNVEQDPTSRVVINERTGTIVIGGNVKLLPSVIAHGGLEISVEKQVMMQQPAPFTVRPPGQAETGKITANEQINPAIPMIVQGATVQDIANALNLLKVSPRDLISIFQALKESGSLQGELIIQ